MSKTVDMHDYVPVANFYFDEKKQAPKNFSDLQINEEATVTVKGKITSISHDQNGKSFAIETRDVKISTSGEKPMSTAAGMANIKGKRTI